MRHPFIRSPPLDLASSPMRDLPFHGSRHHRHLLRIATRHGSRRLIAPDPSSTLLWLDVHTSAVSYELRPCGSEAVLLLPFFFPSPGVDMSEPVMTRVYKAPHVTQSAACLHSSVTSPHLNLTAPGPDP